MLVFDIPARGVLTVKNAVFDFNGTLAVDGAVRARAAERLNQLAGRIRVFVVTADTFGTVRRALADVNCEVTVLTASPGGPEKERFVRELGAAETAAFGNGANDVPMLRAAGLGVAVLEGEGAATGVLTAADVVVRDINDGLDLLLKPGRLVATLRR